MTTAVCGFAITLQRPLVALIAILPITTFALLDAQYLRLERCFRALFERSRAEDWGTLPSFDISPKSPAVRYWGTFFSWSIATFYLPLLAGVSSSWFSLRGACMASLYNPTRFGSPTPAVRRKAYFAFQHHDDIMRVNNVRNAWKISHPDSALNRKASMIAVFGRVKSSKATRP